MPDSEVQNSLAGVTATREIWSGVFLTAVAGYVDAIGFLTLGHLFVSFMSGNSTQFAVNAVQEKWSDAMLAGTIVGLFVGGVIAGRIIAILLKRRHTTAILGLEALLLVIALVNLMTGPISTVPLTIAMGLQNAVLPRTNEGKISVTYVTGSLVHFGDRLVDALFGIGPRGEWLPYLLLWAGMFIGAATGTFVQSRIGAMALAVPVAVLLLMAAASLRGGDPLRLGG
ncbi:MAG TPA: YoaK family protein [Micropepsaceae bacterium]|nr:YoaK family protein [Micropepsaceae bacterium]